MDRPSVLIVGAGPTGLVLALSLARRGVPLRIIDEADGPGQRSRAMVVHARTLELYAQLGIAEAVIEQGVRMQRLHLHESGHELVSASLADMGEGLSPYPFALAYAQDHHERFLVDQLKAAGVEVERTTRLARLVQDRKGVRALVARPGRPDETLEADYLCGCDGAHSQTRQSLAVGFPGGTYDQQFFVADVRIDRGFDEDLHFNLGRDRLVLMLPVRAGGTQRLIGLLPGGAADRPGLTYEDIRGEVEPLIGVKATEVEWFSTYRVHHRVAGRFQVGRVFLLGDAGHIHSPAGGQGMNTGIGDAVNLAWKLAEVVGGRADASLLDSYEPERIAFARELVETTDRLFTVMVAGGSAGEVARRFLAPLVIGTATHIGPARQAAFRMVSQIQVRYRDSPLSEGRAGKVRGGDRLPWTGAGGGPDNFAPLTTLGWHVQAHGAIDPAVQAACHSLSLGAHAFPWSDAAKRAGLHRDGIYLVRPDGYVGLAAERAPAEALRRYVAERSLSFGPISTAGTRAAPRSRPPRRAQ